MTALFIISRQVTNVMDCSLAGNVNGQYFARLNEAGYQELSGSGKYAIYIYI